MPRRAILLFGAVLASLSIAGEPDLRARLERDYVLLGDEDPVVREAATERMLKEGVGAAAFVRGKLAIAKDAEVVGRLLRVLEMIEMEEQVELEGDAEDAMKEISTLESRDDTERRESDLAAAHTRLEQVLEAILERVERQAATAPPEEPRPEPESTLRSPVPNIGDLAVEPKIDGEVLFIGRRHAHMVISAGSALKVEKGMKFTVYRGDRYVSKVVVTAVRRGFATCREILDFRKEVPRKGDSVSTRVFD